MHRSLLTADHLHGIALTSFLVGGFAAGLASELNAIGVLFGLIFRAAGK